MGLRTKALTGAALALTVLSLLVSTCGCAGREDGLRDLDRIHELYVDTQEKVGHLTDFFFELEEFDLENTEYFSNATKAIEESRSLAEELQGELNELGGFNYGDEMEKLGTDLAEYREQVGEALGELGEMYQPLLDILKALEPTLKEEAAITQMDTPQTDSDFAERITRITDALDITMKDLEQIRVPETMNTYKLLQTEMFGALQRASNALLALAQGQAVNVDLNNNVDFDRYMSLSGLSDTVVLDLKEPLKVYNLDACQQKVEDDFYDLYLKVSSEDEDKR
jgi:hypothetical protein